MQKQKIIFLSPVSYFKGGAERSLFDLVSNPNVEAIIVAPEAGPITEKAASLGLAHYVLDFGSINSIHRPFSFAKGFMAFKDLFRASRELKKIARQNGAKIVHSNGLKAHMINCVSRRLCGGARAVIHIRDIPYTKPEILVWHIMRVLCDAMILVSHACWPQEKLAPKVCVIHNGTPLIETPAKPRKQDQVITFGFIGRIHPAKGLHLLIDWLAACRAQNIDARLTVRGTYSEDAPEYEGEINTLIKSHSLEDAVTFTGFIDNPQSLYEGIDIVVVPSETPDPLPRSVMEAMARGIPVFGYPAGGIFEMIEDGKTGYLVDSAEKFSSALHEINSAADALEKMIAQAKVKIEREFTIPALHKGVTDLYRRML